MSSWKGQALGNASSFVFSHPFMAFDLLRMHTGVFPRVPTFVYDGDRLEERSSTLHRDLYGDIDVASLSFESYRWIGPSRHFGSMNFGRKEALRRRR